MRGPSKTRGELDERALQRLAAFEEVVESDDAVPAAGQLAQSVPSSLDSSLLLGESSNDGLLAGDNVWGSVDATYDENRTDLAGSSTQPSSSAASWDVEPDFRHFSSSRNDDGSSDGSSTTGSAAPPQASDGLFSSASWDYDLGFRHFSSPRSDDGSSDSSGTSGSAAELEVEWNAGVSTGGVLDQWDPSLGVQGVLDDGRADEDFLAGWPAVTASTISSSHPTSTQDLFDASSDETRRSRAEAAPANALMIHKPTLHGLPAGSSLRDEWMCAFEILRTSGSTITSGRRRPAKTPVCATKQVFVEPRHHRRPRGLERWHVAGEKASVVHWIDAQHGVRRRHGQLDRGCGVSSAIHHYTLLRRSDEKGGRVEESDDVRVYIVRESTYAEVQASDSKLQALDLSSSAFSHVLQSFPSRLPAARAEQSPRHQATFTAGSVRATIDIGGTTEPLRQAALSRGKRTAGVGVGEDALGTHTDGASRPKRRRTARSTAMLAGLSVVAVAMVAYLQYVRRTPGSPDLEKQCDDGFFMPPSSVLAACIPCQNCLLRGLRTVRQCTPTSNTVCSPWGWEHGSVQATPPSPEAYEGSAVTAPRLHFPQFASSWVLGSSVYTFGGSSGITQLNMSEERTVAGERCTTEAIGVSDELWRFTKESGWVQLLHDRDSSVALTSASLRRRALWPRRRYAATSWTVNTSAAILFSGVFELCLQADYAPHGDLSLTGSYLVSPDSMYWLENQSDWVLLGGSDDWRALSDVEMASLMSDGTARESTACSVPNRLCSWPLPRSHAQAWMLNGVAYLFSGLFSIYEGGFDDLTATPMLLNDLWQIYPNASMPGRGGGSWAGTGVEAFRVAACFGKVEDPSVLPVVPSSVLYPGPRYQAATWSIVATPRSSSSDTADPPSGADVGWLFGGIGRRASVSALPSAAVPSCQVMEDTVHTARVTNLCDLWSFTPGLGFRLVAACEADFEELAVAGMQPASVVAMTDGPTAGVFATAFVVRRESALGVQPEVELWMFGGVTSCAPFNGMDQDGNSVDQWSTRSQSALKNLSLTMCDMNLPGQTEGEIDVGGEAGPVQDYVGLVGFAEGHPDQPCSADLWQFSISEERWQRAEQPEPSATSERDQYLWPAPRCGASVITELGSILDQPNITSPSWEQHFSAPKPVAGFGKTKSSVRSASVSAGATSTTAEDWTKVIAIVGGWGGSSGGECEEWPSCNASTRDACPYKSYLSEALDNAEARSARQRAAECVEMSDTWQLAIETSAPGRSADIARPSGK